MNGMPAVRSIWHGCAFVAAYIACDMLSGPEARYQTIAPVWHPAAGLALYAVIRHGRRALLPLLAAALLAASITPAMPARPALSLLAGLLPVPVYVALGLFTRSRLPGSTFFASHRGMLTWAGVVSLGSLASAMVYAAMLLGPGLHAQRPWIDVLTRYTIAETAGMLVIVPAACCLLDPELRAAFLARVRNRDTVAYTALIALVLAIALQRPAPASLAYYLLMLPLAWAASRQGMAGAVTAAIVLEAGVTIAALWPIASTAHIPNVQMLVLTLTLSGFLIGIAVDVARRASHELRHSLRLAAAGEMAAAVAHELNQPLTALSAYGSACQRLVTRDGGDPLLTKTIHAMAAESQRASNVLKRLREFFRSGSIALEELSLAELIDDSVNPFAEQARNDGVRLEVHAIPAATLLGDRIQLEIVLRNLLSNALQALAQMPEGMERRITVDAGVEGVSIWIRIADNGPGIDDKIRARLFEPFVSLKSSGLGLGLAISRSIVETHGGSLTAEPGRHAVLNITLPAQPPGAERT
ncbi:ATP-binding protein [Massilia niastensis]|uniref:ATP-binding protein n=1 Tax=Massilia niastensis TaxID=544911 RepID=UPI00037F77A3|nr:ATP-binding protein [Massilia niastensis]